MEGEFKNFIIRKIVPEDYDAVCQHVRDFFIQDEMTSKTLGVTEDYANEFEQMVLIVIRQGLSFLAEDKNTGEIANLRLSYIQKKDLNVFEGVAFNSTQSKTIVGIFADLDKMADMYERYGITEMAFFFVASTNPKFRNQGLTKEMYSRSLKYFKVEGQRIAKVYTSSPYSRAATLSLGFEELGKIDYNEYKDSDGNHVFQKERLTPESYVLVKAIRL